MRSVIKGTSIKEVDRVELSPQQQLNCFLYNMTTRRINYATSIIFLASLIQDIRSVVLIT